jgi:hypothetical protein
VQIRKWQLFLDRLGPTIIEHIQNVFNEGELSEEIKARQRKTGMIDFYQVFKITEAYDLPLCN